MSGRSDSVLERLAMMAGLKRVWQDALGREQVVSPDTLRSVLETLGFACQGEAQCRESLAYLEASNASNDAKGLEIIQLGKPLELGRQGSLHYQIQLEDGTRIMGTARDIGGGRVVLPPLRKPGYHRLSMGEVQRTVAVVPQHGMPLETLLQAHGQSRGAIRPWVLGAQVYGLMRGEGQTPPGAATLPGWEVGGDYSLLGELAREAAHYGAVGVAISPVHAMFSSDPARYSPYAPSSRLFLNATLADPTTVFDGELPAWLYEAERASGLNASGCLTWPNIQSQRLAQMRRLFEGFDSHGPARLKEDFLSFRKKGGEALQSHVCYEALHENFLPSLGAAHGWRDWPAEYHEPSGIAVRHFAETHETALRFHAFLQWLAARSLGMAQAAAREVMPVGLIADMAIGTDPRGSQAWSRQQQIMTGVSVGAPPDIFQPEGQDWGLTAFSPWGLKQHGFAGFIETVRAVLAQAGGLRVDHVIGLARMWLVPQGAPASQGVYLGYPKDELMDLLMLEAWRHRALVVGENLGTVPQGFDEDMAKRGFLGMNVLWFEREDGEPPHFRRPEEWPSQSMAMLSTHDLPTARGWWKGRDIEWRERHGEFNADHAVAQKQGRELEKQGLWRALQQAGLVRENAPLPEIAPTKAMLGFLAASPAILLHVSLEDLTGQDEQPNLPGRAPEDAGLAHPNWCRTLPIKVDEFMHSAETADLLTVFCRDAKAVNKKEDLA